MSHIEVEEILQEESWINPIDNLLLLFFVVSTFLFIKSIKS